MGPILPYLPVLGRQMGVSPSVMGAIYSVLPILALVGKPTFGLLVDYFQRQRKLIFIGIVMFMSSCFAILYFLPASSGPALPDEPFENVTYLEIPECHRAVRVSQCRKFESFFGCIG